jgi:multisubunit Na+/H+ antiporter MnhG subunit
MNLDLRIPMGLMFSIIGVILTAFGAATYSNTPDNIALYERSLGINANLWWGIVLLIFGLIMFFMGRSGQKRLAALPPEPVDGSAPRRGH